MLLSKCPLEFEFVVSNPSFVSRHKVFILIIIVILFFTYFFVIIIFLLNAVIIKRYLTLPAEDRETLNCWFAEVDLGSSDN